MVTLAHAAEGFETKMCYFVAVWHSDTRLLSVIQMLVIFAKNGPHLRAHRLQMTANVIALLDRPSIACSF
jgi:hypothetical protein